MNNTVELIGWYGGDITHAQSAWTSTSRELTPDKIERIPMLLKMLADNGHETPFEKSSFHFLVTTDIASHIHILKSRIGVSVNAESARYKELKEDKFYIPEDWVGIPLSKKASIYGSITERLSVKHDWASILENYTRLGNEIYHQCLEDLTPVLGRKRAKESARYFKSYNSQITSDVMFNWRSFNHFYKLRSSEHAQLEIKDIANQMLDLIKNIEGNPFEHTIRAFNM